MKNAPHKRRGKVGSKMVYLVAPATTSPGRASELGALFHTHLRQRAAWLRFHDIMRRFLRATAPPTNALSDTVETTIDPTPWTAAWSRFSSSWFEQLWPLCPSRI